MATLFSDAFTGANAGTLGSNWNADSDADWDLSGNQAVSHSVGGWLRTASAAHSDTANVKVSVTQVSSSGDGGVFARCTAVGGSPTGYVLYASSAATGLNIFRTTAGVDVQMGSGASITHAANKVVALEVSGGSGNVSLKSYYDGVLKESVTDTGATLDTAGRTGMVSWSGIGTNSTYDDFLVEDAAGGGGGATPFNFLTLLGAGA